MTTPKLIPPRDLPVIDLRTGRLTDVWYDYFKIGVPSNKIFGTTTNDSAPEGGIGEFKISPQPAKALTTDTPADVTSLALSAGDWDLFAAVEFSGGASTTVTEVFANISPTSGVASHATIGPHAHWRGLSTTDMLYPLVMFTRASLAAPATYYLVVQAKFLVSTFQATGAIQARRVR